MQFLCGTTSSILNSFWKIWEYIHIIYHFSTYEWGKYLKSGSMEDKDMFTPHGNDLVLWDLSSFSMRRIKSNLVSD